MKKIIMLLMLTISISLVGCDNSDEEKSVQNNKSKVEETQNINEDNIGENDEIEADKQSMEFTVDSRVGSEIYGFTDLPMSWNDLHLGHNHDYIEYGDSEEKYIFTMRQRHLVECIEIEALMEKTEYKLKETGARDVKLEPITLAGGEGLKLSSISKIDEETEVLFVLWAICNDEFVYFMELSSYELQVDSIINIIESGFSFVE